MVVLGMSNLALGLYGVYLIRHIDAEYSVLIDESVPVMNEIRQTSRQIGIVFRAELAGIVSTDPATCVNARQKAESALVQNQRLRDKVLLAALVRNSPAARDWSDSVDSYDRYATSLFPLLTPDTTANEEKDKIERLWSLLDRYSDSTGRLSNFLASRTETLSGAYSADTRSRATLVLGLAGWPLLIVAILTVITLAALIFILFVFRQADLGDGP